MNYENFLKKMETMLRERLGKGMEVRTFVAEKNNGIHKKGMIFENGTETISPVIYLEEAYVEFLKGKNINEIVSEIILAYDQTVSFPIESVKKLMDFENVKDKIVFKVINLEKNKIQLEKRPYIKTMDLAIVFYVLHMFDGNSSRMEITNDHLKAWNTTKEELMKYSLQNTPTLLPVTFRKLEHLLNDVIEKSMMKQLGDFPVNMYIVSNEFYYLGASSIFYPGIMERIEMKLGGDFYLIPSSVHEWIVIPRDLQGKGREEISTIIHTINETLVAEEEILSEHCYLYSAKNRTIS